MNDKVINFEYSQSLSWQGGARWSEAIEARITMTDAALSSGWLREHFTGHKGGATDFIVLMAIVMHARPLKGDDLELMVSLDMVSKDDEGRLYARVTDKGLAGELGIHRKTIASSAERLDKAGFIASVNIPESIQTFRDSHGQFSGTKVYIVTGKLEQFLPKMLETRSQVEDDDAFHRGSLTTTVGDGNGSTVVVKVPHRGTLTATNIKMIKNEEEGEEFLSKIAPVEIFSRFAQLLDRDYAPTEKDQEKLYALAAVGYTTDEILTAMQRAADNLGGSLSVARSFAYLVPEVQKLPPAFAKKDSASNPGSVPEGDIIPNLFPGKAGDTVGTGGSSPATFKRVEPIQLPDDILRTFQAVVRRLPTPVERQRLIWIHAELVSGDSGSDSAWGAILHTLKFQLNPAANNPVAYLSKLLLPGTEPKSPTLRGQPQRDEKSQSWKENADTGETALAIQNDQAPITLAGGIVLTRPPERKSGFVTRSEIAMQNLYDGIEALQKIEKRTQNKPGDEHG